MGGGVTKNPGFVQNFSLNPHAVNNDNPLRPTKIKILFLNSKNFKTDARAVPF